MMNVNSVVSEGKQQNFLLVEGDDDKHVFYNLLVHYKFPECFTIESKGGIDGVKKGFDKIIANLDVELDRSDIKRLGIVVDADDDCGARWKSLRNRLAEVGYTTVPLNPAPDGTIIEQAGRPIVGIWLMPDNKSSGAIEDFVSSLIPFDDMFWLFADATIKSVVEIVEQDLNFQHLVTNVTHYNKVYGSHVNKINQSAWLSKARLRTWLAWQKEPGRPMGLAIKNKYVDVDVSQAQLLIAWLCRLFEIELA
jgi:hypothetical protein